MDVRDDGKLRGNLLPSQLRNVRVRGVLFHLLSATKTGEERSPVGLARARARQLHAERSEERSCGVRSEPNAPPAGRLAWGQMCAGFFSERALHDAMTSPRSKPPASSRLVSSQRSNEATGSSYRSQNPRKPRWLRCHCRLSIM